MEQTDQKPKILIVDDAPENIHTLIETLKHDYSIIPAKNGEIALAKAKSANPDLILLDIIMPGINGYEVCKRLKEDPQTRNIPIIFITAISEAMDEARAFDFGAVDYVPKPFIPVVVKARVKTHLALKGAFQEAENARKAAEKANDKMMQGIQYAHRIQMSLLPESDVLKARIPDSFVIWLPRDVVGGDLWFADFTNDDFLMAVVDCTGHGVPGAFMSIIAFSGFRSIVKEEGCRDPATILKNLNAYVQSSLHKNTEYAHSDDGMDVALCRYKFGHPELVFSGAKRPLIYAKNGQISVIKGERQSIGYKRSVLNFEYSDEIVPVEKGMSFYLTTDGFTDQHGGEKSKCFGSAHFKSLLGAIHNKPFDEQRELLLEALETHRGDNERRDDITILGFGLDGFL